jgi:large subunit ribosomal protein L27e
MGDNDDGTTDRPYPHAIVAGIDRYPLKVTKRMGSKLVAKRSKVKPFIKVINYNHLMPTRYQLDMELKSVVTQDVFEGEVAKRAEVKKACKKVLEERYKSGKNSWFFKKLRF